MSLPKLPRILKKKEADITPRVIKWFEENWPNSVALEIKVGKNKILPHQEIALNQVTKGLFSYKIPDTGRRNPFDAFVLKKADAFVIFCDGNKCLASQFKSDGKNFVIHI